MLPCELFSSVQRVAPTGQKKSKKKELMKKALRETQTLRADWL